MCIRDSPQTLRLPAGPRTTVGALLDLSRAAFAAVDASFRVASLVAGTPPRPVANAPEPPPGEPRGDARCVEDALERTEIARIGMANMDVVSATLAFLPEPIDARDEASNEAEAGTRDGRRLGGGGGDDRSARHRRSPPPSAKAAAGTETPPKRRTPTGAFKGAKRVLGSGESAVGVGGAAARDDHNPASGFGHGGFEGSLGASPLSSSLDSDALDRRVARRVGGVARAAETSTAAMLNDPDSGAGPGDSGAAGAMAADLMRAAEGVSARASASDPIVASLQRAMRAAVAERAAEAEGNAKVNAACAGEVVYQPLADGRVVVRYPGLPGDVSAERGRTKRGAKGGERTDVVQDLPAALLTLVLRVVAADASGCLLYTSDAADE